MSGKLRVTPDGRQVVNSPFHMHWGTDVPSAGLGANGDIYIRYSDVTETFYKKRSGTWEATGGGGGGFAGWTSTNSEIFSRTTNFSSVVVTSFTIAVGSKLTVEKDGIKVYEGYGWTRNTGTNAIDFDGTIEASSESPVLVFVGLYS